MSNVNCVFASPITSVAEQPSCPLWRRRGVARCGSASTRVKSRRASIPKGPPAGSGARSLGGGQNSKNNPTTPWKCLRPRTLLRGTARYPQPSHGPPSHSPCPLRSHRPCCHRRRSRRHTTPIFETQRLFITHGFPYFRLMNYARPLLQTKKPNSRPRLFKACAQGMNGAIPSRRL